MASGVPARGIRLLERRLKRRVKQGRFRDMTSATMQLSRMSRQDKLLVMEAIWADLSADEAEVVSPKWHKDALRDTESNLAAGLEQIVDWAEAKRRLRQRTA
jgi:hypothetical protein